MVDGEPIVDLRSCGAYDLKPDGLPKTEIINVNGEVAPSDGTGSARTMLGSWPTTMTSFRRT